jgi:uncharacterized RDD family membrane protein YckC
MDGKRIIAWVIDYIITSLIQSVLMGLFLIKPLMEMGNENSIFDIMTRTLIITYCSMIYMIIRDILGKKSIGKIIMKLKIVNKVDGNESNILKRLIRNITWILAPVEIIVFLIAKERIGDKIAGTEVKLI